MLPASFEVHHVANVPALTYYSRGHGQHSLFAVNALGQGTAFWLPLIERLSRRSRVVIWEMRSVGSDGQPVTFAEHCQDLHAILQQDRRRRSHLIGWCTGAKLAARYCRTHPGTVESMVFVSGSFKHLNRAAELDSTYERNLQAILEAVVRQPSLAERLRVAFSSSFNVDTNNRSNGDSTLGGLTKLAPELLYEMRRPFRDAQTLALYARQHLEFWSHDETTTGAEVSVPILGIAGEHDEIISPAGFRAALSQFPLARYIEIPGAAHHCFFERPDIVADLIEEFLDSLSLAQTP